MKMKKEWKCKKCGKGTDRDDKVCMVCRTDETIIRGFATKKAAKKSGSPLKKPEKGLKIRSPRMSDGFCRALDLEVEGREFYLRCQDNTANQDGKGMFAYLASEEKAHYDKITGAFREYDEKGHRDYVEAKGLTTGVFKANMKGGNLDRKSDALDALNIGLAAEEKSIVLYDTLSKEAPTPEMRAMFVRLVDEERKHRNILENEVEFVTGTGEFHDFKTVTM